MGREVPATRDNKRLVKNFLATTLQLGNVSKGITNKNDVLDAFSHIVDLD